MVKTNVWPLIALLACGAPGCSGGHANGDSAPAAIHIDGSSTVAPIAEAIAEEFAKAHPNVRPIIGVSGTGGGFQKFCTGETDISNASRPIKATEIEACAAAGVEYVEVPVAYDGIALLVHPRNTWVDSMTVRELRRLWEPAAQGTVTRWSQIRASWPDREIHLFGAGVDSGTYDYFTEAIVGKEGASRGDFTNSEDDNVLVQGIAGDELALGFMGLAYYEQNRERLKLVGVDDGKPENGVGAIRASEESVRQGTYQPLSRPLFIYVSRKAAERPEVQQFVTSYFTARDLIREVGYIALPDRIAMLAEQHFNARTTGTAFGSGGSLVGMTLEQLLTRRH